MVGEPILYLKQQTFITLINSFICLNCKIRLIDFHDVPILLKLKIKLEVCYLAISLLL